MINTLIDVRTSGEFASGHVEGSINIPLQEIPERLEEIRGFNSKIYLCCASGARSGSAQIYLRENGVDCENIGSWMNIEPHTQHI